MRAVTMLLVSPIVCGFLLPSPTQRHSAVIIATTATEDYENTSANAKIAACAKTGDWEAAVALVDGMWSDGLAPDVASYSSAIAACAKAGRPAAALALMDDMNAWGIRPNAVTFATAAASCANAEPPRVRDALALIETMRAAGVAERNIKAADAADAAAAAAARACERAADVVSACCLVRDLQTRPLRSPGLLKPACPASVYRSAIAACDAAGAHSDARRLLREAAADGGAFPPFEPRSANAAAGGGGAQLMDLHGCTVPVARAAVGAALARLASASGTTEVGDLILIDQLTDRLTD